MDRCFVFVFCKMPVNTVIADIEFTTDKPFPEGGITGVKHSVPLLVPVQQISIFRKAIREIIQAEPIVNRFIIYIRLGLEFLRRIIIILFLPMNRNLGFIYFILIFFAHGFYSF